MKLQAHVIIKLALGLSLGITPLACQKTAKAGADSAEPNGSVEPTKPNLVFGPEAVAPSALQPTSYTPVDPPVRGHECPGCGMG